MTTAILMPWAYKSCKASNPVRVWTYTDTDKNGLYDTCILTTYGIKTSCTESKLNAEASKEHIKSKFSPSKDDVLRFE